MATYIVGITGASGAPYALRLLEALLAAGHQVKLIVTEAGEKVLSIESGLHLQGGSHHKELLWKERLGLDPRDPALALFLPSNMAAPMASGSFRNAGMAVVPCSMGALARIANGVSSNLIERAADVERGEQHGIDGERRVERTADVERGGQHAVDHAAEGDAGSHREGCGGSPRLNRMGPRGRRGHHEAPGPRRTGGVHCPHGGVVVGDVMTSRGEVVPRHGDAGNSR